MRLLPVEISLLIIIVHLAVALIENATVNDNISNDLQRIETRRKKSKHRDLSTSSSEDNHKTDEQEAHLILSDTAALGHSQWLANSSNDEKESLDISPSSTSSSEKKNHPKSSKERRGWRKWHRKCTPCPEDMVKKWKNPTIQWICGGYQRARRTFKSLCMMHYRNCQDGTMFVKIHDNRCANDTGRDQPYGIHFFYDYPVKSRSSKTSGSTVESDSSSI